MRDEQLAELVSRYVGEQEARRRTRIIGELSGLSYRQARILADNGFWVGAWRKSPGYPPEVFLKEGFEPVFHLSPPGGRRTTWRAIYGPGGPEAAEDGDNVPVGSLYHLARLFPPLDPELDPVIAARARVFRSAWMSAERDALDAGKSLYGATKKARKAANAALLAFRDSGG